jgi:hypothetical protein
VVIGAWPMIAAAAASVAASMGMTVKAGGDLELDAGTVRKRVVTEVPNSEVLEDVMTTDERIVLSTGDIDIAITRDDRGAIKLCVTGENHSKAELERIGQEVAGRLVQQYAYHKIVTELRERNYNVVEESIQRDQSIQLRVRLSR